MGNVIQFVPRSSADRRPMLEQIALDTVESVTVPVGVSPFVQSLCEQVERWAEKHRDESA